MVAGFCPVARLLYGLSGVLKEAEAPILTSTRICAKKQLCCLCVSLALEEWVPCQVNYQHLPTKHGGLLFPTSMEADPDVVFLKTTALVFSRIPSFMLSSVGSSCSETYGNPGTRLPR